MDDFKKETDKIIGNLKKELMQIRTSRASAGILDGIMVPYYGQDVPVKSCAAINIPDPKTIEIHPWEPKFAQVISTAILKANIGFNPQINGNIIRLNMPPMTVERRRQIVKIVSSVCEDHKVSLRNLRRKQIDTISKMEKEKEISKDDRHHMEKETQKIVDEEIRVIDSVRAKKEKEIMSE